GDRRPGPPRARLLPRRGPRGGYGVPRAAAAREHLQRFLPGRPGPRRPARGAAGGAMKLFRNEPVLELRRAPVRAQLADGRRDRRLEIAALEVRECAKPWPEADADVCEAIDFLEYYARGAVELEAGPELLQVPGERNTMAWRPRGVVAVVSPWNFPVAIPCGM